ncbi:hypothetical protein COCMIDRAFT_9515 [Bipolaris oryzae ATCC 44560]|uniref:Uncharacterized protein n=1 Tax=Bipolaris oryzae ATCC 44560 TaxID=930090 RepID=W6YSN6_COCMI|nr:uncharacterized protein COCMIDRAFT_9515 [Bipolaris oryzae ATCC 44560]EUC40640.1 hypothetical protein COCMIDRAFT_9515 [Bipolaris oryzae ATCC 44560]
MENPSTPDNLQDGYVRVTGSDANSSPDGEAFWDLLINQREGMIDIPSSRWNSEGFCDPHGRPGTTKANKGNFLGSIDPADFDGSFFSMSAAQIAKVDPQHRILLETTYEALENAGESNFRGKKVGVYVGMFADDYVEMQSKDSEPHEFLSLTGHLDLFGSNRVSHEFDWTGPSMTIKTGCSASLVCLDQAVKALNAGDCEAAIVGGANLIMSPALSCALAAQGVNSADGRCRSFDAKATGYGRGEAVSSLLVKRLDDALRDGNPIRAIIRSTVCNDDGKTPGITQPNTVAHEALIRHAYRAAGIPEEDFNKTGFFECHGTGTAVGDPIEVGAVARVFGKDGMIIGSVKSNIGHSEGASGNTSVIKAILSMEHQIIPPNVNFETPNPKIPWKEANLKVPTECMKWPSDRLERASVNSFGIGGMNAHVILESAAAHGVNRPKLLSAEQKPRLSLLLFTAKSDLSLQKSIDKHAEYIQKHGSSRLGDIAYTLGTRREHHEHRTFCVSDGEEPLVALPSLRTKMTNRSTVFVFTGQGAQWAEMGKDLIEDFPSVKENIQEMNKILQECHTPPSWNILEELSKSKMRSQISKAEFSQPLCTVIQIALVDLFRTWNVKPDAVVGHSSGEIAAAYATNGLTKKEAVLAAYFRGLITSKKLAEGAMAAVGLGPDQVRKLLKPGVVVACENSPSSTTISGDRNAVEEFIANLREESPDVFVRPLQVDNAYHSHHMQVFGDEYEKALSDVSATNQPDIPFFSSVTGEVINSANTFTPSYWRSNLENPVLFSTAVRNIIKSDLENPVFLEIGPHSALAGPLRQIFAADNANLSYVSSLARGQDDTESVYNAVGNLWRNNINVDLNALYPTGSVLTDLPTYSWDHSVKFWAESRMCSEWKSRSFLPHETLGVRLPGSSHLMPTWRKVLRLGDVPWIRDHVIGSDTVFPAVGYVSMAGEAIRQLSGRSDYSLREFSIRSAMIVNDTRPVDVVTTFKRSKITTTIDTDWWDFRITSFNGSTWSEHCSGQAKAGPGRPNMRPEPQPDYLRKVSADGWYRIMERIGFTYGPAFRNMRDISANPIAHEAVCTVDNFSDETGSFYEVHPRILDNLLQPMTVSMYQGNPSLFNQLSMPTYIGELYISGGMKEIRVTTKAWQDLMGSWCGSSLGTADGKLVCEMKGLKFSPLGESEEQKEELKNTVQVVWKPDVDFLDLEDLVRAPVNITQPTAQLEKYFFLRAIDTVKIMDSVEEVKLPHGKKFRTWLKSYVDKVSRGDHVILPEGPQLASLSEDKRNALVRELQQELAASKLTPAMETAIRRVHENAKALLEGTAENIVYLMEDNILMQIYAFFNLCWDYAPLLEVLGHCKPTMKILEIGAGTGGTTTNLLQGLISEFGERLYSRYDYTDISAGFFVAAKEHFKEYQGIEYSVLDISKDPLTQGFEEGSYDLIIAANVLHATPSIQETLARVKKLLHPGGRLMLQEMDMPAKWVNFIMAGFSGWWLGEEDGRVDEPYMTPDRWNLELKAAGFTGVDAKWYDTTPPFQISATMISSLVQPTPARKSVSFLYRGDFDARLESYRATFEANGHSVQPVPFGSPLPVNQDVVSFLELDSPFFHDIKQSDFEYWIEMVGRMGAENWLWITQTASMGATEPGFAMSLGFVRTLRSEKKISITTLEIDEVNAPSSSQRVVQVYEKINSPPPDDDMEPDFEFAIKNGVIHLPRYHWISVKDELEKAAEEIENKHLCIGQKGSINGLRWEDNVAVSRPCGPDEIAVRPHTVGVNFRDIVQTQGLIDSSDLGGECSAIVTEVGSEVTEFKVGDRVFGMVPQSYSNRVLNKAVLFAKVPDNLTMVEAATMPTTYLTVIFALRHARRLNKGDTILIHSAAGGVGISAINIAKMIGAKIFATVGTEEKVEFLVNNFGIPREQIFDSHSNAFRTEILAATNGRGVDIALNSLAGEILHETWQCIGGFGAMIEIGKRDFYGHGKIDLIGFTDNRSFIGLDAHHIQDSRPDLCGRLLREIAELRSAGHIQPIQPIKNFGVTEIAEAFRYMQKGTHIGKITVTMPEDPKVFKDITCKKQHPKLDVHPDYSYLLVGGLGGIGRSIALSLVLNGAKHLIFISRSGRSSKNEHFLQELEVLGCSVQVLAGSAADLDLVKHAAKTATKPIRGVIQLAMVLKDQAIGSMTWDAWKAATEPKVTGTWNLHHAIPDVDFFVMFSSISGLMGQIGQANYAAANAFLDAFTQYRHSLGLPASVIDLGVMEDVGFVASTENLLDYFKSQSTTTLTEKDIFDIVRLAISRSSPALTWKGDGFSNQGQFAPGVRATLSMYDPNNRVIWKYDRRFAISRTLDVENSSVSSTSSNLKAYISGLSSASDESVEYVAKEIGKTLFGFLMRAVDDMDIDESLSSIGLDSLVGIELRNWTKQQLGYEISILELMQSTLRDLAKGAVDSILAKQK